MPAFPPLTKNSNCNWLRLKKNACQRVFREKLSGAHRQRPELARLCEQLRSGDTVVVLRLDRLARSTRDLLEIMEAIGEAGASFRALSEPWADTTTPAGKMIMTVFASIAEFERDLIRERTGAGRIAAQAPGVRFGRPLKLNDEHRSLALRLLKEDKSVNEVAKTFTVHGVTIYRLMAEPASAQA